MPIISNGNGTRAEYTIPEAIYNKIPEYFYTALAGELFSTFGWERAMDAFYPKKTDNCDLASGSCEWIEAFHAACRKLDMQWLIDYHNSLPGNDRDIFDSIIEVEIRNRFMKKGCRTNSYYSGRSPALSCLVHE